MEFSGEHATLPPADALGAVKGLGVEPVQTLGGNRVLAFRPKVNPEELAARLALSRYVGEIRLSGSLEEVREKIHDMNLEGKSFSLRVADYEGTWDKGALEADLGQELATTGTVDLRHPERELRLVRLSGACLHEVAARVDRRSLEARKVENCPFSKPVSLHPKFARALVNLTGVPRGGVLLDPFCGTGGIVMEAASIGAEAMGSDLSEEMVEGAGKNLRHFHFQGELRHCDVGRIRQEFGRVDAIATDPPYGRASGSMGEDIGVLLGRAFGAFDEVLRRGGRVAICLPAEELLALGKRHFRLLGWHALRVHRSLVRYFSVFEKN